MSQDYRQKIEAIVHGEEPCPLFDLGSPEARARGHEREEIYCCQKCLYDQLEALIHSARREAVEEAFAIYSEVSAEDVGHVYDEVINRMFPPPQ